MRLEDRARTGGTTRTLAGSARALCLICLAVAVCAPLGARAASPNSAHKWTCNVLGRDQINNIHHFIESGPTRDQARSKAMSECQARVTQCQVKRCHQD